METVRKITVEVPPELLERAQRASGSGITQTVRTGLQLVAASNAYARLRQLDSLTTLREREYEYFKGDDFVAALAARNLVLR